ncbi:MAG: DUF4166 domain-containing protein [Rhodospirillales bacterium]|nr:DUF4166 domain-containing protein [Alphaproteobacteria bacterium]MCB1838720.1 DUF4166 domain-containing protein [Alphaproteobacteria bacterium]MCB9977632.1 DUF4166 domain-containing protein [Rhodospirillales bacterium]
MGQNGINPQSLSPDTGQGDPPITVVYDDECPVCRSYCTRLALNNPERELVLVDARKGGALMEEITARGLDIDEGMVVKIGDDLHYGADAIYVLAQHTKPAGLMGRMNAYFFRHKVLSNVLYPAGKGVRNFVLYVLGIEKIYNLRKVDTGSTIRNQLGEEAWMRLDPNVRARFEADPKEGEVVAYRGSMHTVRRSKMGWLFAHLTRIIGNPLTPYGGTDVPMDVETTKKRGRRGVYWKRVYYYEGRKPFVVTSVKKESKSGEMLECVGGGFGMVLDVTEENAALHFRSRYFFWQMGLLRVRMPRWLAPGETHVTHEDIGEGNFIFRLSMVHAQLGETFFQEGVFR